MEKRRRIVVTGMGMVSCFGTDLDVFYRSLLEGQSGVRPITQFPCEDFSTRFAADVRPFDTEKYIEKKQARRIDPFIRFALVAGKRALEHAQVTADVADNLNRAKCGILVGSGMGGMSVFSGGSETLVSKGVNRITPFFVPYIIPNMGGALLGIDLKFTGPNYSISTACATANYCLISAAEHIRRGDADLMLCGGSEAAVNPIGMGGFIVMKALSQRNDACEQASRPLDKHRDGFVVGEGAAVLVLEELEHAKKRGAPILAEYLGGAVSTDAYHMTTPLEDGSGVAQAMKGALADARIDKSMIDYMNLHATATPVGDLCEIRAIKKVFGSHAPQIDLNATKSMTGHCLGAAAGIEAIVTIQAIRTQQLHPTINLNDPEEEVQELSLVTGQPKKRAIRAAMSNSFGFGGHNSAVVFAPYQSA